VRVVAQQLSAAEFVEIDCSIRFHLVKNTNEQFKRLLETDEERRKRYLSGEESSILSEILEVMKKLHLFVAFQLSQLHMFGSPCSNRNYLTFCIDSKMEKNRALPTIVLTVVGF
jgi:hypothetical protein